MDRGRAPHARHDKGPARGEIYQLTRADTQHRMQASLGEESQVAIRAQAPIRRQHIPWRQARIDRLHCIIIHRGTGDPDKRVLGADHEHQQPLGAGG